MLQELSRIFMKLAYKIVSCAEKGDRQYLYLKAEPVTEAEDSNPFSSLARLVSGCYTRLKTRKTRLGYEMPVARAVPSYLRAKLIAWAKRNSGEREYNRGKAKREDRGGEEG